MNPSNDLCNKAQAGPPPRAESPVFQAQLEAEGQFGPSGLIERASSITIREVGFAAGMVVKSLVTLTAPEGQRYLIGFPEEANADGSAKALVELGSPGLLLPATGTVGADREGDETRAAVVSGLIIGPKGTLRGSHVVATGGRFAASSEAGMNKAGVATDALPKGAILFRVDNTIKLVHVE